MTRSLAKLCIIAWTMQKWDLCTVAGRCFKKSVHCYLFPLNVNMHDWHDLSQEAYNSCPCPSACAYLMFSMPFNRITNVFCLNPDRLFWLLHLSLHLYSELILFQWPWRGRITDNIPFFALKYEIATVGGNLRTNLKRFCQKPNWIRMVAAVMYEEMVSTVWIVRAVFM